MLATNLCPNLKSFSLQILQFVLQLIIAIMTISPIAVQVPMNEIFNDTSCYFHWATMVILPYHMAVGGFGMAIFRVGCIHNLFPAEKEPKEVSKIILVSELVILALLSTINCSGEVNQLQLMM